jgi:hypothetical protein
MRLVCTTSYNLSQRLSLVQKLGLESDYLESCFVRAETMLRSGDYQRPLVLVRGILPEDGYRSVLDYLAAVFVPSLIPAIRAYYDNDGERLIDMASWDLIEQIDRCLVDALEELKMLYTELSMQRWARGEKGDIAATWLDFHARPRFPRVH